MASSEQQIDVHDNLVNDLREIVGNENVLSEPD